MRHVRVVDHENAFASGHGNVTSFHSSYWRKMARPFSSHFLLMACSHPPSLVGALCHAGLCLKALEKEPRFVVLLISLPLEPPQRQCGNMPKLHSALSLPGGGQLGYLQGLKRAPVICLLYGILNSPHEPPRRTYGAEHVIICAADIHLWDIITAAH